MPEYFQDKVMSSKGILPSIIWKCIKDGLRIVRTDLMNAENYRQECTNSLTVFSYGITG